MHTMVLLAEDPGKQVSTKEIAASLCRSEFHLAKVLQRLTRAGFVQSTRGPRGGFMLREEWEDISLLAIYETIEGPLQSGHCISGERICTRDQCLMGGLVHRVTKQVVEYLGETRLRDIMQKKNLETGSSRDGDDNA
jgi:Rrf2 family protein